jgi:hypothetical protein
MKRRKKTENCNYNIWEDLDGSNYSEYSNWIAKSPLPTQTLPLLYLVSVVWVCLKSPLKDSTCKRMWILFMLHSPGSLPPLGVTVRSHQRLARTRTIAYPREGSQTLSRFCLLYCPKLWGKICGVSF